MSRTSVRSVGTVATAVSMLLIAGCGTTDSGAVVGVPPSAHVGSPTASGDSAIAAFSQGLDSQLTQAGATAGAPGGIDLAAETNALASDTSLISAERLDALKALGAGTAAGLEKTLGSLIASASADRNLTAATVDGRTVAQTVLGLLQAAQAQVHALAAKIASDTLVDVLRQDDLALAGSKVHGFIDPQAHLLIAAGDTLVQGYNLTHTAAQLRAQISAGAATDPNYNAEAQLWNQLDGAVTTIQGTAVSAIRQVRVLTPAGFPGNEGALLGPRQALSQLSTSTGALSVASSSIAQIRSLLAQRSQ